MLVNHTFPDVFSSFAAPWPQTKLDPTLALNFCESLDYYPNLFESIFSFPQDPLSPTQLSTCESTCPSLSPPPPPAIHHPIQFKCKDTSLKSTINKPSAAARKEQLLRKKRESARQYRQSRQQHLDELERQVKLLEAQRKAEHSRGTEKELNALERQLMELERENERLREAVFGFGSSCVNVPLHM